MKFYYIPKHKVLFPFTTIIEADDMDGAKAELTKTLGDHNGRLESQYLFAETEFVKKIYEGLITRKIYAKTKRLLQTK